ncbi:MAG: 2-oxoglutarate oxidoreductase [Elusimicrobia bacterium HGW-Elusimicrobia-1]|jgi:2-oxoglutarate ferredoxin oxidoreductase subunit beta|nr:MAG: 2-oxoglutarate oxidoreductase [Elusimicrobia bacterium HGW-Elusimicrobia-1]
MKTVFSRPQSLSETPHLYCPGCGHGIIHRLVAEVIDELGAREKTIGIAPVGCAVFAYDYFNFDVTEAPHGRPPAVATGIKRVLPDRVVFTYQGDGDLAAIGTSEIIHAAARGEKITVIFVNNATYGMTGGQMAPTTMPGQRTTTTPAGRSPDIHGNSIRVAELISVLEGSKYVERVAVNSPKNIIRAKKAIKTAFETQLAGKGFSLVEVLSQCPVDWRMTPCDSVGWVESEMMKYYPLGIIKK